MNCGANKSQVYGRFVCLFLVEVVGDGGLRERKVEIMRPIELNFRCSAFEVFMGCSHGDSSRQLGIQ